jgi:7-carboxy-7-deazaguanine synthase
MKYPINEIFYSIQGEGRWAGTPMLFIRFHGCNLNCPFCDTPDWHTKDLELGQIIHELGSVDTSEEQCERVCLTGGEPLIHDLTELVMTLQEQRYDIHIETNGTRPPLSNFRVEPYYCVSPKQNECSKDMLMTADELKFLCGPPGWEELITHVTTTYVTWAGYYLMPLARGRREGITKGPEDLDQGNTKLALDYCLKHPEFNFTPQLHKYLNLR